MKLVVDRLAGRTHVGNEKEHMRTQIIVRSRINRFLIWVFLALIVAACSGVDTQSVVETAIAQTQQFSELQTAAAGTSASDTPQGEDEPSPAEETATPSLPLVSVSQNTNCRTGPGVNYGYVTTIEAGTQHEVVAVFDANYVLIRNPNASGDCWLWLQYADTKVFDSFNLPQATQPPTPAPTHTPTPTWNWNGTWTMWWGNNVYVVPLTVSGNKISGSFGEGVQMIVIEGTLSNNGQNVSGTWTYPQGEGDGNFEWQLKAGNPNQFVGNNNFGIAPWCGATSGASKPNPCQWP